MARGELFKTLETILPADVFSEAAVDRIFAAVDRDHDGKISHGEFSAALKHAAVERERRDARCRAATGAGASGVDAFFLPLDEF